MDRHHDHRPPTPRFQCSVDGNPSAQSSRQGFLDLTCSLLYVSKPGHCCWFTFVMRCCSRVQTPLPGVWQASSVSKVSRTPGAQEIDENDLEKMAAIHGDSAWQPEWELLAIVVSVDLWRPRLATSRPNRRLRSPWSCS